MVNDILFNVYMIAYEYAFIYINIVFNSYKDIKLFSKLLFRADYSLKSNRSQKDAVNLHFKLIFYY